MPCLTPEQVELLARNELKPEEAAELRGHVEQCDACRRQLNHCAANEEALRKLKRPRPSSEPEAPAGPTITQDTIPVGPAAASGSSAAEVTVGPDSFPGYTIVREIHRGGQGVVFQAIQKSTKRKVALKVLKEGVLADGAERTRFEREIEVLGQLSHPNIVAIHDSGTSDSSFFYVMDYISGHTLDVWLGTGKRPVAEVLRLFAKICDAVNAAHLRGVIHRDLKPGNIRVDPDGEPHVLDFGLAKVAVAPVTDESRPQLMTVTGQFVGTLAWASPEQAEAVPENIDTRSDVYSLGVILYQMLTGAFPYEVLGNIRDVLDNILHAEPTRPSTIRRQVDHEVETIVLKCLSKDRDRRYQTAGELARDVRHYLAGEPIEAKRDSGWYVLRKTLRRHKSGAAASAIVLVVIVLASIVSTIQWRRARIEWQRAEESRTLLQDRRMAESLVTRAQTAIQSGDDQDLMQAREFLEQAIATVPDLEQAYLHRGQTRVLEGLRAPLEAKGQYVDAALTDFEQAYVMTGGQPGGFDGLDPGDAQFAPGLGSRSAIEAAISLLFLANRDQQARRLVTGLGSGPQATTRWSPVVFYEAPRDPLVVSRRGADTPQTARLAPNREAAIHRRLKGAVDTLRPARLRLREVTELLFDSMFVEDVELRCRPNPAMVRHVTHSKDDLTWIVKLREDLTWHDGHRLTAADIEFTWRTQPEGTRARRNLQQVRALDEVTVEVTHQASVATSSWDLAFYPVPKHLHDRAPDAFDEHMDQRPVGNGPYRLSHRSEGEVVLERWDAYPIPPLIRRVHFHYLPDRQVRVQALADGTLDESSLTGTEFRWLVNGASFADRVVKLRHGWPLSEYICWNTNQSDGLFADRSVRRAIAHAVDLPSIVRLRFGGLYTPCHGIQHEDMWACNQNVRPLAYNVAEARRLLDDAGWKMAGDGTEVRSRDGVRFAFELLVPDVSADALSVTADLARQLREVGIEMQLDVVTLKNWEKRQKSGEFDAVFRSRVTAIHPDLDRRLWVTGGKHNYGAYHNPEVDRLFAVARGLPMEMDQRTYYEHIQKLVYEDQPCLFLWWRPALWAVNRRLRGVELSPLGPTGFYPGPRAWWVPAESG